MRRSTDFRTAVRSGQRIRSGTIVIHHRPADTETADAETADADTADIAESVDSDASALVGFVVGRSIGPSVARHRVIRRLRHAVQRNMHELPPGSTTVIRALPTAATASWPALVADVTSGLHRVCRDKVGAR